VFLPLKPTPITQSWPLFTGSAYRKETNRRYFRSINRQIEPSPCNTQPPDMRAPAKTTQNIFPLSHQISAPQHGLLAISACLFLPFLPSPGKAAPPSFKPPEILFIGDSHLSFGAGKVFHEFFQSFEEHCQPEERWPGEARAIARRRFALMGVKSTSPHNWLSNKRSLKKMVCEPDPKWPVNARLYGFPHRQNGTYVQLGQDPSFPFCRKNMTPFKAALAWAAPRLLVLYFTGNTIERWANSPRPARLDAKRLSKQLPKDTGCVFMTTSPVYRKRDNARRVKAQRNISAALAKHGNRCQFVPMLTKETITAIQGNARYFRRRKNGGIKDPYHPLTSAARHLLKIQRRPLCRAVLKALRPGLLATIR